MITISRIMVVDDSLSDVDIIKDALEAVGTPLHIEICMDGESAIQRIGSDPPQLVILDLNMPRVHGFEVLRYIKSREETKHIPVVVFTTSSIQSDVRKTYELNGAAFITKPLDLAEFVKSVQAMKSFWADWVTPK